MEQLIKPARLKRGDMVAAVSLSWGGAGDEEILWRYEQGKARLETEFDLRVVEMAHTLSGTDYIYEHPEARAEDLMEAFRNPEIKAIIACIGGNDSVRMLPYIDYEIITKNPKIFCGFSDTTVAHFICMKAGLSSFYGPSILTDFAENVEMYDYTVHSVEQNWFCTETPGVIPHSPVWTSEFLPWVSENKNTRRHVQENHGYEVLQGTGIAKGRLIGGCLDVLNMIKGTGVFPDSSYFDQEILFLETCEEMMTPEVFEDSFRWFATAGILQRINGMIVGKPYDDKYYKEYKKMLLKVLKECGREDLPVLYNMNFGHTSPMFMIPYGATAAIDCGRKEFAILEPAVL